MTTISSRSKQLFPLVWFGIGLPFMVAAALVDRQGLSVPLLVAGLGSVLGFLLVRPLVGKLADEVVDAGEALIVRKDGDEARVPLADVVHVRTSRWGVTLHLAHATRFGREITFAPVWRLRDQFGPSGVLTDLIVRVDAARRGGHPS